MDLVSLAELPIADVQQNQAEILARVQENNAQLDIRFGPLNNIVGYYNALLATQRQINTQRLQDSNSLSKINADPTLADTETVDAVLSNWGITRGAGAKATGSITIVVNTNTTTIIASGAVFTASGLQFISNQAFVAKAAAANVTTASDRLLTQLDDGMWAFSIDVTAAQIGSAYQVAKNTTMTPASPPLNFVKAYAATDFSGGINPDTNQTMMLRQQEGFAMKAVSGPVTMNAALRAVPAFANVVTTSVIGFGDAEMLRDKHTIFPIAVGGKCDWYVRTTEQPQRISLSKTAVLVAIDPADNYGIWQFSITRNDYPGFYDVTAIRLPSSASLGTFTITQETRANDLTQLAPGFIPDIANVAEGAYSRYQVATIQFKDNRTLTAGLTVGTSEQTYAVEVRGLPLIGEIHDYMSSRNVRFRSGDILVKAPVPCFLQLSVSIQVQPGDTVPDTSVIISALTQLVNRVGFTGRLAASQVYDVIQNSLTGNQTATKLDMFGRIRRPDGTIKYVRDSSLLTVPAEPQNMVSAQTVQFFLTPSDVSITIETLTTVEA